MYIIHSISYDKFMCKMNQKNLPTDTVIILADVSCESDDFWSRNVVCKLNCLRKFNLGGGHCNEDFECACFSIIPNLL